jgi:hypothetical protein
MNVVHFGITYAHAHTKRSKRRLAPAGTSHGIVDLRTCACCVREPDATHSAHYTHLIAHTLQHNERRYAEIILAQQLDALLRAVGRVDDDVVERRRGCRRGNFVLRDHTVASLTHTTTLSRTYTHN